MPEAPAKFTPTTPAAARSPLPRGEDDAIEQRTLRDYYIILRERLWVALTPALLLAIVYGVWQAKQEPLYRATASIKFERQQENALPGLARVKDDATGSDVDLNTYISIISSKKLRNLVAGSLSVDEEKELQKPYLAELPPGAPPAAADTLVPDPVISSQRGSLVVYLTITHRGADAAKLLANRYVDQFINLLRTTSGGTNKVAIDNLTDRSSVLLEQSKLADKDLQDFMAKNELGISLDATTDTVREDYRRASTAVKSAQYDASALAEQLRQIEDFQARKRDLFELAVIAGHGTIPALRATQAGLLRDRELLADRYLENHPRMVDMENSLAVVENQLASAVKLAIADLRASLDKVRANEAAAQRELDLQEARLRKLGDLSVEFKKLQEKAGIARKNYTEVLDRLQQLEILNQITTIPVTKLDEATLPSAPFAPDTRRITRTAVGLFFLVFIGVAVGLSFLDDRIKSAWDVETFIGRTLLGIIPDLGSLKDDEKYRLALSDAQGPAIEPFLGLYSSVKIHSKLDFPKSLLVTSTVPGEGKTLVSCNLAGSFARHGKRTLLIDCDLRRPMLHRHFNKANETGLITWFDNGASLDDGLLANPWLGITPIGENLSLISSGGRSKSPTQFLESAAFAQLIERLKKHFDLIVIDSPPMGAVTDGLLIAERADEVLYVCRFNRAYRKHIRLYIKALRHGKNEILGIVLNGLSPRRIEYYSNYRYYRSYKKYYGSQS